MNSLRDTLQNTFAAVAFAESNLPQEARELLGVGAQPRNQQGVRPDKKGKRQRPSLKA
ncbi:MAG: hypothetical protein P4L39_03255 [Humidesulfovibrio sp.]|nr:hypothetical protein [Humidesulfovibrio sp.]